MKLTTETPTSQFCLTDTMLSEKGQTQKSIALLKKKKVLFHICEVLKQKSAVVKKVIKVVIFGET